MVFGLFSKDRSLRRTIDKATNKLAQQQDRFAALEKLRDDGGDEAIFGLCKRFGITSMKGVEDEQEKNWVVDVLVKRGTASLAPVVRYMKSAEQLAFPLRVLERIASRDQQLSVVDELFASEPPGYVRTPERRIDLIKWFCEQTSMTDAEVVSRVTPYLVDFDENSRFSAIEGLASKDQALIAGPLVEALLRPEEESGRIRRTIVEVLARTKSPLGDRSSEVAALLTSQFSDFKVDRGCVVKK